MWLRGLTLLLTMPGKDNPCSPVDQSREAWDATKDKRRLRCRCLLSARRWLSLSCGSTAVWALNIERHIGRTSGPRLRHARP